MTHRETDFSKIKHQKLSVQISLNGLSFLVTGENDEQVLYENEKWSYATTPFELLSELEKLLNKLPQESSFTQIDIIYATPIYTLVPKLLFDERKASEYLKFNSKILVNDYISHDHLEALNLMVVYVPLMNINNALFEKLGSFDYYHLATILLKTFYRIHDKTETRVFVHVRESSFDCVVFKKDGLELCNSYPYSTSEDFLYYLLFMMEQLQLNPDEIPISLCGEIQENDDLHKFLYNYIRFTDFIPTHNSDVNMPFSLQKII